MSGRTPTYGLEIETPRRELRGVYLLEHEVDILGSLGIILLRDIGWRFWDPIGLLAPNEDWKEVGWQDEYDSYLIEALVMLHCNASIDDVANYLVDAEYHTMCLSSPDVTDSRERATKVANAILELDPRLHKPE